MRAIAITVLVLLGIVALPFLLTTKPLPPLGDNELREAALSHGMRSVPATFDGLLREVQTPDNPMSLAKIELGKKLFFDPILSRDKTISCASCHSLDEGGDDNRPTAIGFHGVLNPSHLNSPTVLNAALAKSQFWDGRARDVEEQASGPIQAPFEMNMTPDEVVKRLTASPEYTKVFREVFESNITFDNVTKAIGAYERTLLTRGAFDEYLEGNTTALSPSAKRGLTLFIQKGCKGCHTGMSVGGQSIQKFPLRSYLNDTIGLVNSPELSIKQSPFPFENSGGFLGRNETLHFRVPILRNINKTSPYFHNGSVKELREAVRIMSKYQIGQEFNATQLDDMVAFLKTLDGNIVNYSIPRDNY